MKKLTFILLFSFWVSASLLAQVSVGVKAGAALSGHASEGIGMGRSEFIKPTFLGGLYVSVPLSDKLSLQPEVLYSRKGNQSSSSNSSFLQRFNIHYINVPIMLQYQVLNRLTVELGPEFSYLLSTGISHGLFTEFVSLSDNPSPQELLLASYRDLDVALNLGLGYQIWNRWSVNLRYNLGVLDISDDFTIPVVRQPGGEPEPMVLSFPWYNRSLQLSVGFRVF